MALRTRLLSGVLAATLSAPVLIMTAPSTASAQGWVYSRNRAAVDRSIRAAYLDVLGREPDARGLAEYRQRMMVEGWSDRDVRQALRRSYERQSMMNSQYVRRAGNYGYRYSSMADSVVRNAYINVLRRQPDAAGLHDYGIRVMRDGWSQADVERALRESPEYRSRFGRWYR